MTDSTNLKVEVVKVETLTPDPNNARTHDKKNLNAIASSLQEFGQRRPIVVTGDGVVIAGNGTLAAAKSLGWTEISVTRTPKEWDYDRARAYALADNRTAELAEWDSVVLADQLLELDAVGWDLAGLGFEPLTPPTNPNEEQAPTELDAIPDNPDPVAKTGDLWLLGEHRVLCGDSFEPKDLERLLNGERVTVVATDPPYAIYGSSTGIGSDIADDKMVQPFFENLARVVSRVLDTFGHAYFCTDWRSWSALWRGATRAGLQPKNMLVWDKGGGGMGNMYAQTHELIGFYVKPPQGKALMSNQQTGQRTVLRPNMLRFSRVSQSEREHNAAKPVGLMEELIGNSSDAGDIVLDLFAGSGSTLIAADNLGRRAFVMEMEPKYVDVIVARWERKTGQTAQRVTTDDEG